MIATAALCLGAGPAAAVSVPAFTPHLDYATGPGPVDVAIGDLNGDGNPDLAVANDGSNTVSVLLGDGQGGFSPRTDFTVGAGPHSVTIADLNGDGFPDLVVSNYMSNTVSVLLNDGHGHFGSRNDLATGAEPFSVAVGDMNGDGTPDLVVANYAAPSVSVFLNTGAAAFGGRADFPVGHGASSVALADFNRDGHLDVVVTAQLDGQIGILLGNGTGGLGAVSSYTVGTDPWSVAIGDLNRDGLPDLVVANFTSGTVSVLIGRGDGTFGPRFDAPAGNTPRALAIADLNGDGLLDVAVPNDGPGTVSLLLGDGTGILNLASTLPTGASPYAVAAGDLNHDGLPDLAVASSGGAVASVLLQLSPSAVTQLTLSSAPNPSTVGQSVTLTAGTSPAITGGVIGFADGSSPLGTTPLVNGTATLSIPGMTTGVHPLVAYYLGDASHGGAVSSVANQTVNPAPTTTTVTSSVSAALISQPVTFNATVRPTGASSGTPDGAVQFIVDAGLLGGPIALTNGQASTGPITSLALGSHSVIARYLGSNDFAGSDSPPVVVVIEPPSPVIAGVKDVPNDQGGRVFLTWSCGLDSPGNRTVTGYRVWRRAPNPSSAIPAHASGAHPSSASPDTRSVVERTWRFTLDGYWEAIATLPAEQLTNYAYEAATTQDSMPGSNPLTAYFVTALTSDPFVYYESAPDSGYSVDNLAPPAPAPFTVRYLPSSAALHWNPSLAADLLEYRLYRGSNPDFVPGPGDLVVATRDTGFVDAVQGEFSYKLTAVDVHGNASPYLTVTPDLPVATLASLVSVDAEPDQIRLLWYAGGGSGTSATIYRRTNATDWTSLGRINADGLGYLRYDDKSIQVGTSYGYRLGIQDAGAEVFVGETWATAEPPVLTLEGARPNPARGASVVIAFGLASDAPGRIELLDVSGRRVASSDVGTMGPGRHTWTLAGGPQLPPAVYVIRLTQGGESLTQRVAVIR